MARKTSGGEFEHHIVALRMRVIGEGNLNIGLESLDAIKTISLTPITTTTQTNIEPTRLTNFQSQRIRFTLENDTSSCSHYQITRLIMFAKPVAIEYPG